MMICRFQPHHNYWSERMTWLIKKHSHHIIILIHSNVTPFSKKAPSLHLSSPPCTEVWKSNSMRLMRCMRGSCLWHVSSSSGFGDREQNSDRLLRCEKNIWHPLVFAAPRFRATRRFRWGINRARGIFILTLACTFRPEAISATPCRQL